MKLFYLISQLSFSLTISHLSLELQMAQKLRHPEATSLQKRKFAIYVFLPFLCFCIFVTSKRAETQICKDISLHQKKTVIDF